MQAGLYLTLMTSGRCVIRCIWSIRRGMYRRYSVGTVVLQGGYVLHHVLLVRILDEGLQQKDGGTTGSDLGLCLLLCLLWLFMVDEFSRSC